MTSPFQGTLLDLLDLLYRDWILPNENHLPSYHDWLFQHQSQPLCPIRTFKGNQARGSILNHANQNFIIVDNEPLAWVYKHFTQTPGGPLPQSIGEGITNGQINASWSLENKANLNNAKAGGVSSNFRDHGIWLAHIHDASNGLAVNNPSLYEERFWRYICLYNIFPWPSPKRTRQVITSSPFNLPKKADLSGIPKIQNIMWCFLKSRLSTQQTKILSFERKITNGFQCQSSWEEEAKKIQIDVTPLIFQSLEKRIQKVTPAPTTNGCIPFVPNQNPYTDVDDLASDLFDWVSDSKLRALQIDGKCARESNPKGIINIELDIFPSVQDNVNQYDRGGNVIATSQLNLTQFNGKYQINGDTKTTAVEEFLKLYNQFSSTDLADMFEPAITGTGRLKLNLSGSGGASGFYMYKK